MFTRTMKKKLERSSVKPKANNFLLRTFTSIFFVIYMLAAIWLHPYVTLVLFLAVAVLAAYEYLNLSGKNLSLLSLAIILLVYVLMYVLLVSIKLDVLGEKWMILLIPLVFILFLPAVFLKKWDFGYTVWSLAGLAYIVLPFVLIGFVRLEDYRNSQIEGREVLLGIVFLIWSNDTFAYLTGLFIGKHKLAEHISPGKTIEGMLGGFLLTALIAWINSMLFAGFTLIQWFIIALITVLAGTLGDLTESVLKRNAGVKDSGILLPGHGGILDRFDGLLFAVPIIYTYLNLVCR